MGVFEKVGMNLASGGLIVLMGVIAIIRAIYTIIIGIILLPIGE
jgi:hypothetical protein